MATETYQLEYQVDVNVGKKVAYNTSGIGTLNTVKVATLPVGGILLETRVNVTAAFNAGTTNVLVVGNDAENDNFVASGDVDESATGVTIVTTGAGTVITESTKDIYVRFTESGTAATAGAADIVLHYQPPNAATGYA